MSGDRLRLDKWLWHARFARSRSIAARLCASGAVRLNGARVTKAHAPVRPGDVLVFPLGARITVVRVIALGDRRGPATEARGLYTPLDADAPPEVPAPGAAAAVAARS